jgi:PAS domain-containing protein
MDTNPNQTVEALARYRYAAIRRAAELFDADGSIRDGEHPSAPNLPGLIASSLEELKVAEEELRAQNAVLIAQRARIDATTRHYRELFLQSPAPILVTDIFGTIFEANIAGGQLFRRAPDFLVRKPVVAMVATEQREEFRRQVGILPTADGPRELHFTINRVGDIPLAVSTTVQLVTGLGPTASGVLYWLFSTNGKASVAGDAQR